MARQGLFSGTSEALGLALEALDLPFVPGGKARKAPGLVFLTQLGQGGEHDGGEGHPLVKAAASQHMTQQGQAGQSRRRLIVTTRDLRTTPGVLTACLSRGLRDPALILALHRWWSSSCLGSLLFIAREWLAARLAPLSDGSLSPFITRNG
jgi:hypothetical protein